MAMSKARKSNAKRPAPADHATGPQPLRGIEKVAWWSVPAVGIIAVICASTIGVLYFIQPQGVASKATPKPPVQVEKTETPKAEPAKSELAKAEPANSRAHPHIWENLPRSGRDDLNPLPNHADHLPAASAHQA